MQTNSQALWAVSQSWLYLSHRLVPWLVLGILLALVGVFLLGRQWGLYQQHRHDPVNIGVLLQAFKTDHAKIEEFRLQMQSQLSTLNRQMGRVQAHITRVNLLGEKLRDTVSGDPQVFDFTHEPPLSLHEGTQSSSDPLIDKLEAHERILQERIVQLETLYQHAQRDRALQEVLLQGKGNPVDSGVITSHFGKRRDPFHGKMAWHAGVDITANAGAEIKALAGGLIKFAGHKGGYGQLVEIDHGNGLISRYGHNQALFVETGQVIHKGQIIALLGTSGRSTGPHLHLEIQKDGKPVDPGHYFADLKRT